ncbi:MAG: hypothetical protein J5898_09280, partial [Lachnospiraceae bacterium]|nr:hypothetical protein [Lachnospiraceae bacterium]
GYTVGSALGHDMSEATCAEPAKCSRCSYYIGTPLGHRYIEATCTDPATCSVCGYTIGSALGHDLSKATCTEPAKCSRCSYYTGTPLGHRYIEATCTDPATCSVCGYTVGSALGHHLSEATCTEPAKCTNEGCNYYVGTPLGHRYSKADCWNPATCTVCGTTIGSALGHDWVEGGCLEWTYCSRCGERKSGASPMMYHATLGVGTCTESVVCDFCGKIVSEATGHFMLPATCEEPSMCLLCGHTEGVPVGHRFAEATCQAPATCTICGKTTGEKKPHIPDPDCIGYDYFAAVGDSFEPTDEYHYTKCLVCRERITEPHTLDYIVNSEGASTHFPAHVYACTKCYKIFEQGEYCTYMSDKPRADGSFPTNSTNAYCMIQRNQNIYIIADRECTVCGVHRLEVHTWSYTNDSINYDAAIKDVLEEIMFSLAEKMGLEYLPAVGVIGDILEPLSYRMSAEEILEMIDGAEELTPYEISKYYDRTYNTLEAQPYKFYRLIGNYAYIPPKEVPDNPTTP